MLPQAIAVAGAIAVVAGVCCLKDQNNKNKIKKSVQNHVGKVKRDLSKSKK